MHETHLHKVRPPQIIDIIPLKWANPKITEAIFIQAHDWDSLNYRHLDVICSISYVDILFSGEDGSDDIEWNVSILFGPCGYDEIQLVE